jgi:hypothetical protein
MDEFLDSSTPPEQRNHWTIALFGSLIGRLAWVVGGYVIVATANAVCPGWIVFILFAAWALPLLIVSAVKTFATFVIAIVSSSLEQTSYGRVLTSSLISAFEECFTVGAIVLLSLWVF